MSDTPKAELNTGGLKKNTAWMMCGNTYYAICQWLVLVALARLGGAADVGVFMLALSLTGPVVLFFELGMRAILATDVKNEHDYAAYFLARALASLAGLSICLVIAFIYGSPLFWIIVVIGLSKTTESFSQMYYGYALQQQRHKRIAVSLVMRGTVSTLILMLVYVMTNDITMAAAAYTISWLAALILYDRYNVSEKLHSISRETFRNAWQITRSGLPLGVTALLGVLGLYIPRYFLEHSHGVEELGIFSSMAYFITVGHIVVFALGQAMMPTLARYNADGETQKFRKMVLSSFGLVFLMGILGVTASVFIGEWVLEMMYGAEFSARADVLPIIALAAAITYLANIIGYAINAKRIFMAQAPAQLLVVLGSVLGAWYYVPTYGLDGAAYVLVLSSVIMFTSFLGVLFLYRHK
jgi:O-antigen/teichoic acid export membrane protein